MEELQKRGGARNVNVIVLGNSQAGKTSLIVRFTDDRFSTTFASTLGVDFKVKTISLNGQTVRLQIWDTSGQERFKTITKSYYDKAMGVILVYDSTNEQSFLDVRGWMRQLYTHARRDVVAILVAAKSDRDEIKVAPERGKALADEFSIPCYQTSAKTGSQVEAAFTYVAQEICQRGLDRQTIKDSFVITSSPSQEKKHKSSCC